MVASFTQVRFWCSGTMVTLGRSVYLPAKDISPQGKLKFCAEVRPGCTLLSGIRPQSRHREAMRGGPRVWQRMSSAVVQWP